MHKIVFDQRYLLLNSKERKQVFEQFVKERAEEERKEKRQRQKVYREQFIQLLEESNITSRTSFSTFMQKYGKDGRFRNIERSRDRESYFNEFISDLKRKERDEREKSREKVCYFVYLNCAFLTLNLLNRRKLTFLNYLKSRILSRKAILGLMLRNRLGKMLVIKPWRAVLPKR